MTGRFVDEKNQVERWSLVSGVKMINQGWRELVFSAVGRTVTIPFAKQRYKVSHNSVEVRPFQHPATLPRLPLLHYPSPSRSSRLNSFPTLLSYHSIRNQWLQVTVSCGPHRVEHRVRGPPPSITADNTDMEMTQYPASKFARPYFEVSQPPTLPNYRTILISSASALIPSTLHSSPKV